MLVACRYSISWESLVKESTVHERQGLDDLGAISSAVKAMLLDFSDLSYKSNSGLILMGTFRS